MLTIHGPLRLDISRDDGTVGGCTSGFNVRSGSSIFVLTAGHCVGSARHTHHDTATHEGHPLVEEYEPLVNTTYPTDYAIMPFRSSALGTWFNHTALRSNVDAYCPGGCDGSHDVPITGYVDYSAIQVGWVVCAAGAGYTPKPGENYVDSGTGPDTSRGCTAARSIPRATAASTCTSAHVPATAGARSSLRGPARRSASSPR
jgi:streptogrisin C